jgi:fluoroacetyl-CoA thioesterase
MVIPIGKTFSQCFEVTENQTAAFYGSGNLDVFSTPAMIACMENTAMKLIETELPKGMSSVGTEINVKHLKACLVGEIVVVEAKIKEVEQNKIRFDIHATDARKACIGTADHTRYIIDVERFMGKLKTF